MNLNIIDSKPLIESVAVITPTIGKDTLKQCINSVRNQTFSGKIKHHVVLDGRENFGKVVEQIEVGTEDKIPTKNYELIRTILAENVGKNNWYGHRVYAAFSFLFNADAVVFLDEDNWFDPDHIESLVSTVNDHNLDWAFSYRKIYDKDGNYLVHDNCESLGVHPAYVGENVFHVDTSSYLIRKDVAVRVGGAWYGQWGADRQYFSVLVQHFQEFLPSQKHSLCYRLDGNENSVNAEFFERGNKVMHDKYGDNLPWLAKY